MRMVISNWLSRAVFLAAGLGMILQSNCTAHAQSCNFSCYAQPPTLNEQFDRASTVVVVAWESGTRAEGNRKPQTTYRVKEILKSPSRDLNVGSKLTIERFRKQKVGDQFLLMKEDKPDSDWQAPVEATPDLVAYVRETPGGDRAAERLHYFLKFLEHPQADIAEDAFSELSQVKFKEIAPLADRFPREKLRKWLLDPTTRPNRTGLYGLMLGLCGNEEDLSLLEKKILKPVEPSEFRLGIEGLCFGYLLRTKEQGLDKLDKGRIKDEKAPYSEIYAVMVALRSLWNDSPGTIRPERLLDSMRLLLDRPEVADIVVADLARWKDWGVQDRLTTMYGKESHSFAPFSTRRAIIRYLRASIRDVPTGAKETPAHVRHARECLEELRKRDRKLVADVEKFPDLW